MRSKRATSILILLSVVYMSITAVQKKVEKEIYMPTPDAMVNLCLPHSSLMPCDEPTVHKVTGTSNIKGIDVSHYQGKINWSKVATDPQVKYCYIKATESNSYIDDCYEFNINQARKAGILAGAYHFFSPRTSPIEQLQNFISVVKLKDQDLLPLIDVETIGKHTNIHTFRQNLKTFLEGVERHYGVKPLIYTGQNFFNKYLAGHFSSYGFMIAKYREDEPELNDSKARMLMWQFTSTGRISGIHGNCDQSVFMNDYNLKHILIK